MASPPIPIDRIPHPPDISCSAHSWSLYEKIFPYGRWNNTNSNYKLFPITECKDVTGKIIRTQTKNLFKNTARRMSQKQVYSFLVRNGIGPYTR